MSTYQNIKVQEVMGILKQKELDTKELVKENKKLTKKSEIFHELVGTLIYDEYGMSFDTFMQMRYPETLKQLKELK